MTCPLPPGFVPPAFISSDNMEKVIASQTDPFLRLEALYRSRRKRRSPLASFSHSDNSTCEIYLGFVLDALPTYENTSKSLPNVAFTFTTTFPNMRVTEGVKEYNPDTEDSIQIKVGITQTITSFLSQESQL